MQEGAAEALLTTTLLTVCENGYGKRTSFEEYRLQSRGGYGVINIKTTRRNGKVVGMKSVRETDELMLITQNGMIVRTGIGDIRAIGRATQGVRVITLKPSDKLVSIARVAGEEAAREQLAPEPSGGEEEKVEEKQTGAEELASPPAETQTPKTAAIKKTKVAKRKISRPKEAKKAEKSQKTSSLKKAKKRSAEKPKRQQSPQVGPDEDDDVTIL